MPSTMTRRRTVNDSMQQRGQQMMDHMQQSLERGQEMMDEMQQRFEASLPDYMKEEKGVNVRVWLFLAFGIYLCGSFLVSYANWFLTPVGIIVIAFAMNQFYRVGFSCSSLLSDHEDSSFKTSWLRYAVGQMSLFVLLRPMSSLYASRPSKAEADRTTLGWIWYKFLTAYNFEQAVCESRLQHPFLWILCQFFALGLFAAVFFPTMVINVGWSGLIRHWAIPFIVLHIQLGTLSRNSSKADEYRRSTDFFHVKTVKVHLVKIAPACCCKSRRSKSEQLQHKGPSTSHEKLIMKIGKKWVNASVWKHSHPGGATILERLNGADCTEMFNSLHSKEALAMVARMGDVGAPAGYVQSQHPSTPNKTTLSFRAFREQLEKDGYFQRNWLWDTFYISIMTSLVVVGTVVKDDYPNMAIGLIGLGMQQAGWIAHDYVHGRGKVSFILGRLIGGLVNGFSSNWWSTKHNTHHCHTNQVGIDEDIQNDPILHLHIPHKSNDFWFRKYQHYYYHLAYSFLYVSWRTQGFQRALADRYTWEGQKELLLMAINYSWLVYLGPYVGILSVIFGGWLVAEVVTATHQSEELIEGISYQFAEDQFKTTRNVHLSSGLGNWFWGGMQWQLEHHLFPTMPKYHYQEVSQRVKQWAKSNGISYRSSSAWEIMHDNFQTMKAYASVSVEEFQRLQNPHHTH